MLNPRFTCLVLYFFFLPFAFPFTHSFPIILDECIRYLYFIL